MLFHVVLSANFAKPDVTWILPLTRRIPNTHACFFECIGALTLTSVKMQCADSWDGGLVMIQQLSGTITPSTLVSRRKRTVAYCPPHERFKVKSPNEPSDAVVCWDRAQQLRWIWDGTPLTYTEHTRGFLYAWKSTHGKIQMNPPVTFKCTHIFYPWGQFDPSN